MADAIIQARAVEKFYVQPDGNRIEVIAPTDLEVNPGQIVALLGPSGSGKSTLLRILTGLSQPSSGDVLWHGQPISSHAPNVAIVFQSFALFPWLNVLENVEAPLEARNVGAIERRKRALKMVDTVGLDGFESAYPKELSGGMKQRVGFARALVVEPEVLFMDEPTANLDPEASKTVRDFILDLKKEKKTIFLNTHNLNEAQRICDRIAILNTKLMALGTPAELERSASGRKIVVQLESVNNAIISAAKKFATGSVEVGEGNKLIIGVDAPEKENPDILSAIGAAGGRIQFVTEASSSLEDVYLKLVRNE